MTTSMLATARAALPSEGAAASMGQFGGGLS